MTQIYEITDYSAFQFKESEAKDLAELEMATFYLEKINAAFKTKAEFKVDIFRAESNSDDNPPVSLVLTQIRTRQGFAMDSKRYFLLDGDWITARRENAPTFTLMPDSQMQELLSANRSKLQEIIDSMQDV
jgi:hypothetical protein